MEGLKKFQKITVLVLDSGYSAQIDCLLTVFVYTADNFSNLFYPFELF